VKGGLFVMAKPYSLVALRKQEEIKEAFARHLDVQKVAAELAITEWQVRTELAKAGKHFRDGLIEGRLLETILSSLEKAHELIREAKDLDTVRKLAAAAVEAYQEMAGRSKGGVRGRVPTQAIQNIINLGPGEAERLTQTAQAVDGEIIDDTNP